MKYSNTKNVSGLFEEVVKKTKEALSKENFGVLTEIDVKATMKKKLNADYNNYIILGACNPEFANKALLIEYEIGLMLPCNVIVYEKNGKIFVSAIMPTVAMGMIENPSLLSIAKKVESKLKKAVDSIK